MNRRRLWASAIVSSSLLGAGGCESAGGGESLAKIPFVSMTEDLRIGAVDDPDYAFSMVVALEVGPNGTIFSLHPQESAVVDGTLTSLAHVRMDPDGSTVDTLLTTPVGRSNVLGVLRDGGGTFMSQPFSDADLVLVENDRTSLLTLQRRAALSEGQHEFRLTRVDLTGDTVFSRNYPYQPVPVTADTVQKAVDSAAEGLHGFVGERTGTTLGQWRGWIREAIYVPDYYAPVREVVSGRDGTIWLARNPAGGATVEWLILDRNGEPVGRTETPAGFRLLLADSSMVWGVLRDDMDVDYIVRHRAERL